MIVVTTESIHGHEVETNEITIDPTTGIKQQVWFDSDTGQRHYEVLKN